MILPPTEESLQRAAAELLLGGVVGVPTETVYGLAGCIDHPEAVERIFELKGRPRDNPLIVHVGSVEQACALTTNDGCTIVRRLAAHFWPGPLTIVVPSNGVCSDFITAGLDTVALRMPDSGIMLDLIRRCQSPLAAPSANVSGRPSPTRAEHVEHDFSGNVAVLDGGACKHGLESTVVQADDRGLVVLRPGAIDDAAFQQAGFGAVRHGWTTEKGQPVRAPGMKYRHYAPTAQVQLCRSETELQRILVVVEYPVLVLSPRTIAGLPQGIEHRALRPETLYDEFRRADVLNIRSIVVLCDDSALANDALMNRLQKAASAHRQDGNV